MRNNQIHNYSWRLKHPFSIIIRKTRQKINKDIEELPNIIKHYNLSHKDTPLNDSKMNTFSNSRGIFTKIYHILSHKTNNKLKKIEIIQSILFDQSEIRPEINNKKDNNKISKLLERKHIWKICVVKTKVSKIILKKELSTNEYKHKLFEWKQYQKGSL